MSNAKPHKTISCRTQNHTKPYTVEETLTRNDNFNCLRFAQSHQPTLKQSTVACSSSFAYCALAFSSLAIVLPFLSLLSYKKKQMRALLSIHPPSLPFASLRIPLSSHKRSKSAAKSCPDAGALLKVETCTLFRQRRKPMRRHVYVSTWLHTVKHTNQCVVSVTQRAQSFTHICCIYKRKHKTKTK